MSDQFKSCIVRVLSANGSVVGAGFGVYSRYVVTCAHVVAQALGIPETMSQMPTGRIQLDFPLSRPHETLSSIHKEPRLFRGEVYGKVILWHPVSIPPAHDTDIAVIELETEPPKGTGMGRLITSDDLWGHSFRAFGFPGGYDNGVWASGVIRAELANGWVEIEDTRATGYFVQPGFSGTPVWDDQADGIVGMVVAAESLAHVRAAFIIPSASLIKVWPALGEEAIPPCPYRGLFAFHEQHAPFFFGRDDFINKLVDAVHKRPLVAVIGPSGSGKSSVVLAGLIPSLRHEGSWLIAHFRPGERPFQNLAAALIPHLESQMTESDRLTERKKLTRLLSNEEIGLKDIIERIIQKCPDHSHLLLFIDQFEEIFTLCENRQERELFLDRLITAIKGEHHKTAPEFVQVYTMRADFLNHALAYRPLADALENSDLKLGPMNEHELSDAIEKPAQKLKVKIEDGLTERIISSVSHAPGNLPLLEFAMTRLWANQKKGRLTHESYDHIGGIEKALASYAEEVYDKFTEKERKRIHRIFIQLVCPGEGTSDTRRIAIRSEVGEDNWSLVTRLADARLVITGQDKGTADETVEIVHEALIGAWDRLQEWMKTDRAFRLWQDRLRVEMHQWEDTELDEGALLRGSPLVEAGDWLQKRNEDLSIGDKAFIKASLDLQRREHEAKERLRKRITLGISGGLLLSIFLAIIAGLGWWRSEKQRQLALSRQLVAQAELTRNQQPNLLPRSVLLAIEAMKRAPCLEADQALRYAVALLPRSIMLMPHDNDVTDLAFSPDGRYLATANRDLAARVWDIKTGKQVLIIKHKWVVTSVTFSPNGEYLATASEDDTAGIWEIAKGRQIAQIAHNDNVSKIVFSPDGRFLATASSDHTASIWDTYNGKEAARLEHADNITDVAFSPDGGLVATVSWDRMARLWEMPYGKEILSLKHSSILHAVAFSLDGRYIVTAGADGFVRMWGILTGREVAHVYHNVEATSVAFSPDGKYAASASADGVIKVWLAESAQEQSSMHHNAKVTALAFCPDSTCLATSSEDSTARLWDIRNGRELQRMSHKEIVTDVAFNPAERQIATASTDNTARVWGVSSLCKDSRMEHGAEVKKLTFTDDGNNIVTLDSEGIIRVIEADSKKMIGRIEHLWPMVDFSYHPSGRYLATACADHSVRIWDTINGEEVGLLEHTTGVYNVLFSLDGRYLAMTDTDNTVWIWKMSSRKKISAIKTPNFLTALSFSTDSGFLVTVGIDNVVRVWDINTGSAFGKITPTGTIDNILLSPDGNSMAITSKDKGRRIVNIATGNEVLRIDDDIKGRASAFNLDGSLLAITENDNKIRIIRVFEKDKARDINHIEAAGQVTLLTLSFDGTALAAFLKDNTLQIWKTSTGKKIMHKTDMGEGRSIAFSPDGDYLITSTRGDPYARIWEVKSGNEVIHVRHSWHITKFALSEDANYIATISNDHTARIWHSPDGQELLRIQHKGPLKDLAFSPDGKYIITSIVNDPIVYIWDAKSGKETSLISHEANVKSIAISPDGEYLATASGDKTIQIWKIENTGQVARMKHEGNIKQVLFSPDAESIAAISADQTIPVRIWNTMNGKETASITYTANVDDLIFSPDGKYIVTTSGNRSAILWKTATGKQIAQVYHEGLIYRADFSPDGGYFATASADQTARIWNARNGQECVRVRHNGDIYDLAFSPDGKYFATASADHIAQVWLWRPEDMINEACFRLCCNLTREQWRHYFGDESYKKTCPALPDSEY